MIYLPRKKNFEDSLARIDQIIEQIEDADFNESLNLYEEGLKLINDCSNKIDSAQQKVMRLENDFSLKNFDEGDE